MNIEVRGGWVKAGDFWIDSAKVEGVYKKHDHLVLRMISNKVTVPIEDGFDLTTVLDAIDKARQAAALTAFALAADAGKKMADNLKESIDRALEEHGE